MAEPGYAKGYAAGRRRAAADYSLRLADYRQMEFEQAVFIAVLPQLLATPWKTGEKTWASMEEFVNGARKFAQIAAKKHSFSGFVTPTHQQGKDDNG